MTVARLPVSTRASAWAATLALTSSLTLLASPSAFASRAHILVTGTGDAGTALNGGSLSAEDAYNVFYNPAYVNDYKNWAIIEKSNFPGTSAQAGFATAVMNFSFGFYFNRGNAVAGYPGIANAGTNYAGLGGAPFPATPAFPGFTVQPIRPLELFVGSDMGIRWGLGLTWASAATAAGNATYAVGHFGLVVGDFEPFATFKLSESDPVSSPYIYRVGARYRLGEWTPYFALVTVGADSTSGSSSARETTFGIGLARSKKLAEGILLNYSVSYWQPTDTGAGTDSTRYLLPIELTLQGEVTSWLTLQAGITYRALDRIQSSGSSPLTAGDSTTGRLGAALRLGKADLEWAVGRGSGTETQTSPDAQNFDLASGFFTAASLDYRW